MNSSIERVQVAIIGTGFAGLAMAIKLEEAGFSSFVLLEKSHQVGGTWRDNHYPGCACDIPAHLYSFSFEPNPDWSSAYAGQPEIQAYIERVVERHRLRPRIRFGAEVVAAELDKSRAEWTLRTADGRLIVADIVVTGTGGLSRPSVPKLPGLERFRGRSWHSAAWDHAFPLTGKTVAVIGTGASAIQFVPKIAPEVGRLDVFQRTPPWILPRADHDFTPAEQRLFRLAPVRWLYRQRLYWQHEWRAVPFTLEPRILGMAQRLAERHLAAQIADPALRARLTPSYQMGCKRILISNDYYPALTRPNAEVVTDAIREVTADGLVTADGARRRYDAIVFGTGFAVHDYLGPIRVLGRGGQDLAARWQRRAEAYLGTTVAGFPNLFILTGPNTGLGHNSIVFMIESQVRYVISALRHMRARSLAMVEPRADVMRRFNASLQERMKRTVWTSGCKNWYQDPSGVNTITWPGLTAEYMLRTWRFDPGDYELTPRERLPATNRRTAAVTSEARSLSGA